MKTTKNNKSINPLGDILQKSNTEAKLSVLEVRANSYTEIFVNIIKGTNHGNIQLEAEEMIRIAAKTAYIQGYKDALQ